ncbi:MAG: hypothetical protein L0331_05915 [Chloroflexi bacterium]|nr:hypothetical protein [Chloroflexota bacterium]
MHPGGKGATFRHIINQMPPHRVYIESHLGGGAVMANKRPARLSIGLDVNPAVLQATAAAIAPGSIVVAGDVDVPLGENGDGRRRPSPALAMLQVNGHTGNGDRARAATPISGDAGATPETAMLAAIGRNSDVDHTAISSDVAGAQFHFRCVDAARFLAAYRFAGDEFVYADPPYPRDTRRSARQLYEFEYTDEQHEELLKVLLQLNCCVAVSSYWSELYADTLAAWRTISFTAQTRGGGTATEWLWMNYPEPVELHDYRWLGNNFRERERIKRKKQRWLNRLQNMDVLERRAILWAIQESGLHE